MGVQSIGKREKRGCLSWSLKVNEGEMGEIYRDFKKQGEIEGY